jgi:5-methyltetrahydrofolate--homocysteine methyltransferase
MSRAEADYDKVRSQHANKKKTPLWTLEQARANATPWTLPTMPPWCRVRWAPVFKNFDLAEIARTSTGARSSRPGTWPALPAILDDEVVGEQARKVLADAQAMLKKIIEGRWLQANGVMGLFPANRVGDDIVFYTDESRSQVLTTWYGMRQQTEKQAVDGVMRPSRCLADFVATRQRHCRLRRPVRRHRGHWCREEGQGIRSRAGRLQRHHVQGPGRPPGRSLCRMPAPARAQGPVGLCRRRG